MEDQNSEFKKALRNTSSILSKRLHSLKELKQKLSLKYSTKTVAQVLKVAQEKKWLESEEILSKQITTTLHKKNKSWHYIKNHLEKKGLPLPEYNKEKEIEKSRQWLLKKFLKIEFDNLEDLQKARQFLLYRGFEKEIIREVLPKGML